MSFRAPVFASTLLVAVSAPWFLRAAPPTPAPASSPSAPAKEKEKTPVPATGEFLTSKTVVRVGVPQAIAVRVKKPGEPENRLEAVVERGDLEILRNAAVGGKQSIGFIRVLAKSPGEGVIRVNQSQLRITAVEGGEPVAPTDLLRIVSPTAGSAVWRPFSVGVEAFDPRYESMLAGAEVRLRYPDRTLIQPSEHSGPESGPLRRLRFDVDPSVIAEGKGDFVAVARCKDGTFVESEPLTLTIVRPPEGKDRIQGECEDILVTARTEKGQDRFGQKPPKVDAGDSKKAAGERYVVNAGPRPAWNLPITVESDGEYQLMLRVLADFAGGGFPSVTLYLNEGDRPVTAARTSGTRWHWMPVGKPITLKAGENLLTPFFANDFNANKTDRNLWLDKYDLVRLSKSSGAEAGGDEGGEMMMMAPMLAMQETSSATKSGSSVAFVPPLDDAVIASRTQVRVVMSGLEEKKDPPEVSLLVNGVKIASQKSKDPVFELDPEMLKQGENTLKVTVRKKDTTDSSEPVRVIGAMAVPADAKAETRKTERIRITDSGWVTEELEVVLPKERRAKGQDFASFSSNYTIHKLMDPLPDGEYEIVADCRGDGFEGPPQLAVSLTGETETRTVTTEVGKEWKPRSLGVIRPPAGTKSLEVSFTNDHFEKNKGDRNLYVRAVELRPIKRDKIPPIVKLEYPKWDHPAYVADAVIVSAADNRKIKFAEIILDGKPTGYKSALVDREGRILIPLSLRGVSNGPHKLEVRVEDDAGNAAVSQPGRIQVSTKPPAALNTYARALRLTQRFGFGPEPAQMTAILLKGEKAWFEEQIGMASDSKVEAAARAAARLRMPKIGSSEELSQRIIQELLMTEAPVRARFVLWIENHFSTWVRKVGSSPKWNEHRKFDAAGVAPFLSLLKVSSHSPAMLYYLDQQRSFANRLNENYARELMELHTLGVDGGYSQKDVTTMARLLNGWMLADEADPEGRTSELQRFFRYDPTLSDEKQKEILGVSYPVIERADRYDQICSALEVLTAHPSTAKFISTKLAEHYAGCPAPPKVVEDLTKVFQTSGGDMKEMLRAIANHPVFWDPALEPKMATPMDYALRLSRITKSYNASRVMDYTRKSGMGLYERSTPDGYQEENEDYMNSNVLLQRWRLGQASADQLRSIIPAAGEEAAAKNPQGVIDFLALRLTGMPLGVRSNEAAMSIASQLNPASGVDSVTLATFVAQLPEANLR